MEERALWWVLNVALWLVRNVALWWVLNVALWWVLNVALWWVLNVASFLTSFRSGRHALTGGMCDDLTTMSDCLIGGMVWSDHHIGLFDWWNGLICPPHGAMLTDGMCDLTVMWYWADGPCGTVLMGGMTATWCCVDWWNGWWSDHHVVLGLLVECMMIWPPCGTRPTGGMDDDLTTMWY